MELFKLNLILIYFMYQWCDGKMVDVHSLL